MSSVIGISCGFHDAAISVVGTEGDILFAGHSERYSKKKHDENLSVGLIEDAMRYAGKVDQVAYYENPWKKWARQVYAGQRPGMPRTARAILNEQFARTRGYLIDTPITYNSHHLSHAAAGFQTSPFAEACVVVIDAIGEWDTISIWKATYNNAGEAQYERMWGQKYPHSLGLLYSAFTKRVGLKPLDEEYILMGMAAWGKPKNRDRIFREVIANPQTAELTQNLHLGIDLDVLNDMEDVDIANVAQSVVEECIGNIMHFARSLTKCSNLVYSGGVALNCTANRLLGAFFDKFWIMPNPGDAGSSLGAAALAYKKRLNWTNAFLGYDMGSKYPVDTVIKELLENKIVGVASGRAEFGPRALGNRSLLADPRGVTIKQQVNEIKRRQQFRPFAPVILAEFADDYFHMPFGWSHSPYMQTIAKCKHPEKFPAIIHVDQTSRVQTVEKDGSGIRQLLEAWYAETGCPMLLNTSLNIRGEPMVNDISDAKRFTELYGVKVAT